MVFMEPARHIVGSASLLLLPGARAASAQPTRRRPKVVFLLPTAPDDVDTPADRVRAGLSELGYVDGQTVSLEARFAHYRLERLPALAAELVAAQPDVIHTFQTEPTAVPSRPRPRLSRSSLRPSA